MATDHVSRCSFWRRLQAQLAGIHSSFRGSSSRGLSAASPSRAVHGDRCKEPVRLIEAEHTNFPPRSSNIEVAIIIEEMQRSKSCLRWSPHPRMIADTLTKDDISKGNGALEELLRSSKFALWDEDDELARRKADPTTKGRSKRASTKLRSECVSLLGVIHGNRNLGELLKLTTCDQPLVLPCDQPLVLP